MTRTVLELAVYLKTNPLALMQLDGDLLATLLDIVNERSK